MAAEDETSGGNGPSPGEAIYWRLRGQLQAQYERHVDTALGRLEGRILERIDLQGAEARRAEDQNRQYREQLEQRLRAVEGTANKADAVARVLMFAVPLGFTAVSVLVLVLNFLHLPNAR